MSQRVKVSGTRSVTLWLLAIGVGALVVFAIIAGTVLYPLIQTQQRLAARQADAARHYQAGVAFAEAGSLGEAARELSQVIALEPGYRDAPVRLATVNARIAHATATVAAAQATVTAQGLARVEGTALARASATAEALAVRYERALGLVALGELSAAQEELRAIFQSYPTYRDVQAELIKVNATISALTPTITPSPTATFTPSRTPSPTATFTPSPTPSPTVTYTPSPTRVGAPTPTPDATLTPTNTAAPKITSTPIAVSTAAAPADRTATAVFLTAEAVSNAPTRTPVPTRTHTPTPNRTATWAAIVARSIETVQAVGRDASNMQINPRDHAVYLLVPAGEFLMGSSNADSDAEDDEKPQHTVYLDEYWIMQTEVTRWQYARCVEAGKCKQPSDAYWNDSRYVDTPTSQPWAEASAYCAWAGARLPTEAQWEKAARGTDGRIYPWGTRPPTKDLLNYNNNLDGRTRVGAYSAGASPYGVLDMAGNEWEWVADWYSEDWYQRVYRLQGPVVNPTGPASGRYKVVKGGSASSGGEEARAANRELFNPGPSLFVGWVAGFRCVRSR